MNKNQRDYKKLNLIAKNAANTLKKSFPLIEIIDIVDSPRLDWSKWIRVAPIKNKSEMVACKKMSKQLEREAYKNGVTIYFQFFE